MSTSPARSLEGTKVLIVEDEFLLADDLTRAVNKVGGRTIGPAKSVSHAQELIAKENPDAAILDINLRGELACEFVEQLTARRLPCLIVSGYGEDALPESLRNVPRLEKPVNAPSVVSGLLKAISARS